VVVTRARRSSSRSAPGIASHRPVAIAAIENTSITTVHLREGAPARLITMNDCNHIYDPVLGPLT